MRTIDEQADKAFDATVEIAKAAIVSADNFYFDQQSAKELCAFIESVHETLVRIQQQKLG